MDGVKATYIPICHHIGIHHSHCGVEMGKDAEPETKAMLQSLELQQTRPPAVRS